METGFAQLDQLENLAVQIQAMAGVAEVDYGQSEFEQLENLVTGLRYGGIGIGLLIFLAPLSLLPTPFGSMSMLIATRYRF